MFLRWHSGHAKHAIPGCSTAVSFDNCSCVILDCCSRRNSTSSIHGVVPSPVYGLVRQTVFIELFRFPILTLEKLYILLLVVSHDFYISHCIFKQLLGLISVCIIGPTNIHISFFIESLLNQAELTYFL